MATLVSDVLTYARDLSQTDVNGIDNVQGLQYANDALENFTRELIKRYIDASQIQEAKADIVNAQGSYAYPSDKYFLKTMEINFTDSSQGNFIQAQKVDVSNLQGTTSFDWLRLNQPVSQPLFNDHGDTFEIFPTPISSNTAGIKIIYFLIPTEYISTATALVYPQTLDYRCLGARVAAIYLASLGKKEMADNCQKEYKDRIEDIIRILAPQSQQPINMQPLRVSGWNF